MKTFSLEPSNWNVHRDFAVWRIYSSGKAFCGNTRSGKALDQSLGLLDLEELKQAASNGEAGLVRRTAPCGNPTPLGMLHAAGLGAGTVAVRYGGIRQFPRVTTSMPTRAFFTKHAG